MPNQTRIQITKMHIEGFKSYISRQTVEFSPITLFFGSNSSGKSTAIQVLRWLGVNAYPTFGSSELSGVMNELDLGNFRNIVSNHDEDRQVEIELEVEEQTEFETRNLIVKWKIAHGHNPASAGVVQELSILDMDNSGVFFQVKNDASPSSGTHQVSIVEKGSPLPARNDLTVEIRGIRLVYRGNTGLIEEIVDSYSSICSYLRKYQFVPPHREQLPRVILSSEITAFRGSADLGRNVKNDWAREVLLVSRNPRQLENVNFHLSQLDVPYRLNFVEVPLDGLPQIALSTRPLIPYFIDRDTGVEVFARDIGYGVSQVLPVVIACSDSRRKSHVMVEQPELHLHPRVQSRLADLFFSAINQGLQLSVETHSEHLIYRAQRLIREGKAQSSQICINYVERTRLGSVVHRLRLGDSGNFLDAWPGGFFDERLEELLS